MREFAGFEFLGSKHCKLQRIYILCIISYIFIYVKTSHVLFYSVARPDLSIKSWVRSQGLPLKIKGNYVYPPGFHLPSQDEIQPQG